jgi:UDP:flavonoid glycosyltransferase YjiC (YdhE family)
VVHNMLTSFIAQRIASMNDQVSVGSLLYPIFTPTHELPVPMLAREDYGPKINYFSHAVLNWITNTFSRSAYAVVRRGDPELPPVPDWPFRSGPDGPALVLYAFSPSIIPPPSDWDTSRIVTGYWQLERPPSWRPDPSLLAFLGEGPKPIHIGFGSMSRAEHVSVIMGAVEAVHRHGYRGVVQVASENLAGRTLPDDFLRVDYVPHEWLFPHMAALIHHGGAGTTAAGLRAGVPMVVVPFYGDQPFWGRLVQRRTGGPAPIPRRQLSIERLQQALQDVLTEPVQSTAAALGRVIQSENGVSEAVVQIERAVR